METLLFAYGYGKPKERVEVTGENGGPLTVDVLGLRERIAEQITKQVNE